MADPSVRVAVIFYSMTGNILELARAVAEGVERVPGASPELRPVKELIPDEIVRGNPRLARVSEEKRAYPEARPEDLAAYDAFMFGTPTRYGRLSAQLAEFLDRTGDEWQEGVSVGKPAGVFTSTSSVHGGQETTIASTWATLVHLGMIPVGVPYTVTALFDHVPEGGSPYGASSVSGADASIGPTARELEIARQHGSRVAELALLLKEGALVRADRGKSATWRWVNVEPARPEARAV